MRELQKTLTASPNAFFDLGQMPWGGFSEAKYRSASKATSDFDGACNGVAGQDWSMLAGRGRMGGAGNKGDDAAGTTAGRGTEPPIAALT